MTPKRNAEHEAKVSDRICQPIKAERKNGDDIICGEPGQEYRAEGLPTTVALCDQDAQTAADKGKRITPVDSGHYFVPKPPAPAKRKNSENQLPLFAGLSDSTMKPNVESKFSPSATQIRPDAGAFDIPGRSAGLRPCRSRPGAVGARC
jgi:hypothetical protein